MLMDRLKATEEHSEKSAAMVLQRVEEIDVEMKRVRGGVQAEFAHTETNIDSIKKTTDDIIIDISKVKNTIQVLDDETKVAIRDLTRAQDLTNDAVDELTRSTNERIDILVENITACDEMIREQTSRSEERDDSLFDSIQKLTESFEDFKVNYVNEMDNFRQSQNAISLLLQKTVDRQNVIMTYIESLQQFDVTGKITKNQENIDSLKKDTEQLDENINTVRINVSDIHREQQLLIHDVEEIPGKINAEAIKIEATAKEVRQMKDIIKYMKTSIQDHSNQIEDLSLLKEQVVVIRDVCESQDDRMKKILRTVGEVSENSEVQEKRIDEMANVIQNSEEKTYNRIAATKRVLEELFTQQMAEMDSKLQVMKDTVAILQAGPGQKKGAAPLQKVNSMGVPSAERVLQMVEDENSKHNSMMDESLDKILELVEICSNFEEISAYRNIVPRDLSSVLCSEIATHAQSFANMIASQADSFIIQQIIRGETVDLGQDDPVVDKRQQLIEKSLTTLREKLHDNYPNAGAIRLEARDMFVTRFNHALQLAMSKHDQIIATGTSRLGRIKIPACIACDRPLVTKVLRDKTIPSSQRPRSPLAPLGQIPSRQLSAPSSWPEDNPFNNSSQISASLSMDDSWPGPQQPQFHGNSSSVKFIDPVIVPSAGNNNRAKTSDGKRLQQRNGNQEPSLASLPSTIQSQQGIGQAPINNQSGSGYVLRGGFKMPRNSSANGNRLD
eukprot:CAMPEP_0174819082 /NCGR_PEP_ID=MMETSP1107-20130205/2098_1 /TAXON_ID=36770 /ORGANISM="Paraphysomonas vestita, Strain GFlagA" /LENGTH=727 /DNA_ID=CAMNT_0016031919 /DNA_START=488 /DNA_END=2671 /DNA_ORIENTATION=-